MRYVLAIYLCSLGVLGFAHPAHGVAWDDLTIADIIDDVDRIKDAIVTGDIPETAADFRRQLDDLSANGAFVVDVAPKVLRLLQDRRQAIEDFAGSTFDCEGGTPCAAFRQRLRDFGADFASLADRLPMLARAGAADGSRFATIVDRTPPFLLFFVHEALERVPDWEHVPGDLAEIVDEVGDPDAFAVEWRPSRARAAEADGEARAAADTFCARKADRVADPTFDKVALNRWKAALTSLKLVVAAFAEFVPDTVGGAVLGEGLSDVKLPVQAIVKAIASAVEASGVLLDTFQANLDVCRGRLAAVQARRDAVESDLATCTSLNVYRTAAGNDEAHAVLSAVLETASANGQSLTAAQSAVRIVDSYRRRKQWSLAYKFMCKAYARIGDEA
jgi:hypothetical protein